MNFGVPFNYTRLILIAAKVGLTLPAFPSATHHKSGTTKKKYITVRDAISDLSHENPSKDNAGVDPVYQMERHLGAYAKSLNASDVVHNHSTGYKATRTPPNTKLLKWDEPAASLTYGHPSESYRRLFF